MPYKDKEKKRENNRNYYEQNKQDYYYKCIVCGKDKYVTYITPSRRSNRCVSCALKSRKFKSGKDSHKWKGGRIIGSDGYVLIYIEPESPYSQMVRKGTHYVPEHRLIMAQYNNRCLETNEHVHHLNGIKGDNRIDNLQLMSQQDHNTLQSLCSNCNLRKEIRLLHWQIKEQQGQIRLLIDKLVEV